MNTEQLRANGFRVYVKHRRRCVMYDVAGRPNEQFLRVEECPKECSITRGGYTIVELVKGDKTFMGTAHCSNHDNFNKKIGLKIALGRAYKEALEVASEKTLMNA